MRQADKVVKDARFVADSMPNVEPFAVERALRRLKAVHDILTGTQDPWLKPGEVRSLVDFVISLGQELEAFQAANIAFAGAAGPTNVVVEPGPAMQDLLAVSGAVGLAAAEPMGAGGVACGEDRCR